MSGYITDTGSESFDRAYEWGQKDRKVRQAVGVDAAIREGVGEMMQRGGSAGYQPPMQAPWGGSGYQPPGASPAPVAAPAAPAAATPAMTPAPAQAAPGASLPAAQPEDPRFARLRMGTIRVEDPTGRAVNPWGFSGFYQFGTAALKDAGVYEPSPGEDLKRNAWTGTINLPSGKRLSHAEFNADPEAQKEAWDAHQARLGTEIDRRGLNRYIGQTIGGIPITEDAIRSMMHIGGAHGAQLFLTTGGAYNPADANGTTLSAYAAKVLGGGQGGSPAAGGQGGGSVAGMGLFGQGGAPAAPDPLAASQGAFNARMDPILSQLARTPGGGATALSVLGQQSKYDMALGKRSDAYQRLAMTALGKGDIGLFQYYAKVGGLNIPNEVVQNAGVRQRLAVGSLTAERLYRDDPQQAAVFAQAYMQTGDVGQAFRVAGPPRSNPRISVQQVYDAHTNTIQLLGVQTAGPGAGTASPVTGADGQAVTGNPRPTTGRQSDREIRLGMLRAAGFDEATANSIAAGVRPSPNTIANTYTRVQKMVQDDFQIAPDRKAAEAESRMAAMFGPDWQSQMRGQPGQGANPPAQVDDGIPTLTPEQARQAAPGTRFRTTDGRVMRVPAAR